MDLFNKEKITPGNNYNELSPLADRLRPGHLDEVFGQEKIIGENSPLRKAIENDKVPSLVFWGPPGSGKTTLAYLIAKTTQGQFISFSAVTSGIKEVKKVLSKAADFYKLSGRRTYVFIDEIHRFNKAQQDAFLPYVEKGDVILIGATTENPSFEINSALLSRMRVFILERLSETALREILKKGLNDQERGLGKTGITITEDGLDFLINASDGDARRGLVLLENTASFVGEGDEITGEALKQVYQKAISLYDKAGEEHYNLISVLHKTIRGGDPNAALYWLARMLDAGEEPMYIIRRLVRFATEDIGLADPYALTLTLNARDSYHFLGSPEGELAIAQAVVYMACAPKSNSIYAAFDRAKQDAQTKGSLPVPLDLRNAPTKLMKELGYGKNYHYAHDYQQGITEQRYFPDEMEEAEYYTPGDSGREKKLSDYLNWYRECRRDIRNKKDRNSPK